MNKKIPLLVGIVLSLILLYFFTPLKMYLTPTALRTFIEQFGTAAPLIYILLYIVLTLIFFPATVVTILGGLVFGTFFGVVYAVIGATIAATFAFYIARYFGRQTVEKLLKGKVEKVDEKISSNGFASIATMRLLFLPYMPISYAAGLTKVKAKDFVLATLLTNIPGAFAFAYLGNSFGDLRKIVIAIVLVILVMSTPKIFKKFKKK